MGFLSRSFATAPALLLVTACASNQPVVETPETEPLAVDGSRQLPLYEYQEIRKDYTCSQGMDNLVVDGERVAQVITRVDAFYGKQPMRDLILMDGFDTQNHGHPGLRIDFVGAFEDGAPEAVARQWCRGSGLNDIGKLVQNLNGLSIHNDYYRNVATTTCEDKRSAIQHETTWAKSNISGEFVDQDGTRVVLNNDNPSLEERAQTFYGFCNQMIHDFYAARDGETMAPEPTTTVATQKAQDNPAVKTARANRTVDRLFKPVQTGIEGFFDP